MNHVLHTPDSTEPVATLTYGEDTFEIPYLLMRQVAAWIAAGARGTPVEIAGAAVAAFQHVESCMLYDSMPKLPEMHRAVYALAGVVIDRPKWTTFDPNPPKKEKRKKQTIRKKK